MHWNYDILCTEDEVLSRRLTSHFSILEIFLRVCNMYIKITVLPFHPGFLLWFTVSVTYLEIHTPLLGSLPQFKSCLNSNSKNVTLCSTCNILPLEQYSSGLFCWLSQGWNYSRTSWDFFFFSRKKLFPLPKRKWTHGWCQLYSIH